VTTIPGLRLAILAGVMTKFYPISRNSKLQTSKMSRTMKTVDLPVQFLLKLFHSSTDPIPCASQLCHLTLACFLERRLRRSLSKVPNQWVINKSTSIRTKKWECRMPSKPQNREKESRQLNHTWSQSHIVTICTCYNSEKSH
jgi:hypothetical protein